MTHIPYVCARARVCVYVCPLLPLHEERNMYVCVYAFARSEIAIKQKRITRKLRRNRFGEIDWYRVNYPCIYIYGKKNLAGDNKIEYHNVITDRPPRQFLVKLSTNTSEPARSSGYAHGVGRWLRAVLGWIVTVIHSPQRVLRFPMS